MIISDSHVHIHACHSSNAVLDAAIKNFSSEAKQLVCSEQNNHFVLWLTESFGIDEFSKLYEKARSDDNKINTEPGTKRWTYYRTNEPISLIARCGADSLIIIAGKQIVTAEDLEILALGTRKPFNDHVSFLECLKQVLTEGVPAVIPWGFGKWYGRRGKIVDTLITSSYPVSVGDNGGRAAILSEPKLLTKAKKNGISILSGTDPLPFPDELNRVGSFGWYLDEQINLAQPAKELMRFINNNDRGIKPFGKPMASFPFLKKQTAMLIKKRLRT